MDRLPALPDAGEVIAELMMTRADAEKLQTRIRKAAEQAVASIAELQRLAPKPKPDRHTRRSVTSRGPAGWPTCWRAPSTLGRSPARAW